MPVRLHDLAFQGEVTMNRTTVWALGISVFGCSLILGGAWAAAQDEAARDRVVEFAGLKGPVPKDWHETRPLQKDCYKRYQLDPIGDIKYNAHVTLFRLDKDTGGSAADALKRWQEMFLLPQGQTTPVASKIQKFKVGGLEFTSIDITGTFKGFADEPDAAYLDFRLIGVYVQTPNGVYLARLIGPSKVVEFYRKGFEDWLKGLH
jgi:hypothetical protein